VKEQLLSRFEPERDLLAYFNSSENLVLKKDVDLVLLFIRTCQLTGAKFERFSLFLSYQRRKRTEDV